MKYAYPKLRRVLDHMAQDQGTDFQPFKPDSALAFLKEHLLESNPMQVSPFSTAEVDRVEAWLGTLGPRQLETFSVGDREDMDKLLDKMCKDKDLRQLVEKVMEELFMAVGG